MYPYHELIYDIWSFVTMKTDIAKHQHCSGNSLEMWPLLKQAEKSGLQDDFVQQFNMSQVTLVIDLTAYYYIL